MAQMIFGMFSKKYFLSHLKKMGTKSIQEVVFVKVFGNARQLLGAERLVLNCMQRMMGLQRILVI